MYTPKEQNTESNLTDRLKQICLIIAIILAGFFLYHSIYSDNFKDTEPLFLESTTVPDSELSAPIIIHVKGEVLNPGVYEIKGDFRLKDAIDAAGGLTENADKDALNLAMFINDGDEIIIPSKGSASFASKSSNTIVNSSSSENGTMRVNINTATAEQLSKLPGIGLSLAEQIIQYRTYIKFTAKEDIKNVPGIGNSKYDKIRDYIYVK